MGRVACWRRNSADQMSFWLDIVLSWLGQKEPILEPETSWEKEGRVNNVVFACGAAEDNDSYWVYYGGADTVIGVASISKQIVWDWAKDELSKSRYHQFDQIGGVQTEETIERTR